MHDVTVNFASICVTLAQPWYTHYQDPVPQCANINGYTVFLTHAFENKLTELPNT